MDLNPFDLRGPQFLVFYVLCIAGIILLVRLARRWRESGEPGTEAAIAQQLSEDPYQAAFLRGGKDEMLRVAVISLIERGLLRAQGDKLAVTSADAVGKVRRPLDKAILTRFVNPQKARHVYTDQTIQAEASGIQPTLEHLNLLPNEAIKEARKLLVACGVAVLWIIGLVKLFVAFTRGHTNVIFLILLMVSVPFLLLYLTRRRRTLLGDKTWNYLQDMFAGLKARGKSLELQTTSSELTYLAAIFGVTALPLAVTGMINPLDLTPPRPPSTWYNPNSGGCSSCGTFSSCGSGSSSCGGGGGSSCGGGCGGGCGGCGG